MTSWTPALDAFEANLDRLDEALGEHVAWEELDLTAELPAFEGEPTSDERQRFESLQQRAATTLAAVQGRMAAVRDEQDQGDKKVAAARTYGQAARPR